MDSAVPTQRLLEGTLEPGLKQPCPRARGRLCPPKRIHSHLTVCHVTAPRAALSRTLGSAPSGAGEPWRSAVEADERCHPLPHSHGGGAGLVLVIPPSEGERGCLAVDAWNPGPAGVLAQALRPPGQVTPILRCWVSCGQGGDSCPGIACCPAGPGWSSRFTACIPASCSGPLRALPCPPVPAQPACRRCWECGGKQSREAEPSASDLWSSVARSWR